MKCLRLVHACAEANFAFIFNQWTWTNCNSPLNAEQPKVFPISGLEYLNMDQNLTSKGEH